VCVSASGLGIRTVQLKAQEGYYVPTGAPSLVNTTGPTRSGTLSARESTSWQEDDWGIHQQQEQPAGVGLFCQVSYLHICLTLYPIWRVLYWLLHVILHIYCDLLNIWTWWNMVWRCGLDSARSHSGTGEAFHEHSVVFRCHEFGEFPDHLSKLSASEEALCTFEVICNIDTVN